MSQLPILSFLVLFPLVAGVIALFLSANGARWLALLTTLILSLYTSVIVVLLSVV